MPTQSILLYVTGAPPAEVAAAHGDYAAWFERLTAPHEVALVARDVAAGARLPDPRGFAGVVITGSPASVTAPEPWMEEGIELIRRAAEIGTPVLGVCFGHQLIGAAFGAGVIRNPAGREMATHAVDLTDDGRRDPLFAGVPARFEVNLSHTDIVAEEEVGPENGVRVLARNARAPVQAIAAGDAVRGVQFHPEFSGAITRSYLRARYDVLAEEAAARGDDDHHPERLLETARDCPHGEAVYENFITRFVRKA